jgi:hypothetical protein
MIRHLARWMLHALSSVQPLDTRGCTPARMTFTPDRDDER